MIARMWRGWVADEKAAAYVAYVRAFAGDDVDVARFYPEDDEYLVDRETTVSHFAVEGPPPPA